MKRLLITILTTFVLSTAAIFAQSPQGSGGSSQTKALFPEVVARVNGKPVPGKDVDSSVQIALASIGSPEWKNLRDEYKNELVSRALGSLIATELIYQKAEATGVKVSDLEVQAEISKLSKGFPSEAEMNAAMAQQGMDRVVLAKAITRNLILTKYIEDAVHKKISVSPSEISEYYSSHKAEFQHPEMARASHIMIRVSDTATPQQDAEAKKRMEGTLARLKKGEDFAKVAAETSMDAESGDKGGDLGYFTADEIKGEFGPEAFSLAVGQVSGVIRTRAGYHVIRLTEKKKEGISTLEEVRAQLTEYLKTEKSNQELTKLLNELRTQAKIETLIPVQDIEGAIVLSPRP